MKKLRVGIIFGGKSGEHEVSVNSAASVLKALDPAKYEVTTIGITKEGRWLFGADPVKVLENGGFGNDLIPTALIADPENAKLINLNGGATDLSKLDVIFPVLHGTYGEDGRIQGLFDLANIPYVGSGVLGSAVGMDKIIMKTIFTQCGLPQVDFLSVSRKEWEKDSESVLNLVEKRLGFPCFIKPANLGSSVGINKALNREQLRDALNIAATYDRRIVVEEGINAREIEVGVLGNDEPIATVPGEIVPCNEFYDYKAKYIDGDSALIIPAELTEALQRDIREMAVKAFLALDCAGLSRVDFFIDKDTNKVLINEVNTLPGFTEISMYPKLWEATGISYSALIDRLIQLALERHADRNRMRTDFSLTE